MCDKKFVFPAIFEPDGDEIMVTFPDLDGCFSNGENMVEAYLNARDALALYLHELENVPKASEINAVNAPENSYVMLVSPDEDAQIEYVGDVDITEVLEKAIKNKGYTKYKVAKIIGISEGYMSRIVSGERKPSTTVAQKLSELLEFDWRVFYTTKF